MAPRKTKEYLSEAEEEMFAHKYELDFKNLPRRQSLTNKVRKFNEEEATAFKIINTMHRYNKSLRPDYLRHVWRQVHKPNNNAAEAASEVPLPMDMDDDLLFDQDRLKETLKVQQEQKLEMMQTTIAQLQQRRATLTQELASVTKHLQEVEAKYTHFHQSYLAMFPTQNVNSDVDDDLNSTTQTVTSEAEVN